MLGLPEVNFAVIDTFQFTKSLVRDLGTELKHIQSDCLSQCLIEIVPFAKFVVLSLQDC